MFVAISSVVYAGVLSDISNTKLLILGCFYSNTFDLFFLLKLYQEFVPGQDQPQYTEGGRATL